MPGREHNTIVLPPGHRRHRRGRRRHATERIYVAILGSDRADVADVELDSFGFGPAAASALPWRCGHHTTWRWLRDVNEDGHPDLIVRFKTRDTGLIVGEEKACLEGRLAGEPFRGCQEVNVIAVQ